jgi:hypothetical protein
MARAVLVVLLMAHVLGGCDSKPAGNSGPLPPAVTVARPLEKTITECSFCAHDRVLLGARR